MKPEARVMELEALLARKTREAAEWKKASETNAARSRELLHALKELRACHWMNPEHRVSKLVAKAIAGPGS